MSNITDVYNAILSELVTLYPNKTKIPNPYSLQDNPSNFLKNGYGLTIESTTREDGEIKNIVLEYNFTIVLTKEIVRTDSDDEKIDDNTILLLEDLFEGQKRFYQVDQLGVADKIRIIELGTATNYETFVTGDNNFISGSFEAAIQITEVL